MRAVHGLRASASGLSSLVVPAPVSAGQRAPRSRRLVAISGEDRREHLLKPKIEAEGGIEKT